MVNHYMAMVDKLSATSQFPALAAFLPKNLIPWVSSYLKFAFTKKFKFPDYTGKVSNGIYPLSPAGSSTVTLAIAGDWATGTKESAQIAQHMCDKNSDWTIHLGDVYYVGDETEVNENCLGITEHGFAGVKWPHGARGSFALNGNHEMYANGTAYFTKFLTTLGPEGDPEHQPASFFCLDSEHWRIIAVDTGYNSVGVPLLSQVPGLKSIAAIGGDCHLQPEILTWLRDVVKPHQVQKATLLLSHHQYFSAFEQRYPKPANQIADLFKGQELVWIWGHEHRLAIYDKFNPDGILTAYGRCLGHSGMPPETGKPKHANVPLKFYDPRSSKLEGSDVGVNGYLVATINGKALTLEYRDLADTVLFVETFTPGANGSLEQVFENKGLVKPT